MSENMSKYLKRKVQNKMLTVRNVTTKSQIKDVCHILYITSQEKQSRLFGSLSDSPILTVGEPMDLADSKTMITFARRGIKLKYRVNKSSAEKIGFKFSEKLLKAATEVN